MKGGKMKRLKQIISLLMMSCLICGTMVHAKEAETSAEETLLYKRMLEAYLDGRAMEEWAVKARKQIAEELGLSEYLDDRSFLSVAYRNENDVGRDGDITDPKLNLLVEMATKEEEEAILAKSSEQTFLTRSLMQVFKAARSISSGQTVNVTQMARVSGAGNGYFTVGGANSYGYCALNKHNFWSNNTTKSGIAYEWDDGVVRKALYYGPGGPGYAGAYYGSLGADMDYVTFAVGYQNGECNNNTKARNYISFLSSKTDPLAWGYKAYKVDIANPYQDVAFLGYTPVTTNLTIDKRSQTDLYSGDGNKYLTGTTFGLYAWNGSSYANRVATAADHGDGTYTFYNISRNSAVNGYFLVKEEIASTGYSTDYFKFNNDDSNDYKTYGGRQFLLDSNLNWSCYSMRNHQYPSWGFTFLDYPNDVTVTITKKDSETGEKLTGAEFELWAYRGDNAESLSGVPGYSYKVGDFKDNEDGTYSISFPFDLATFNGSHYWFMYKETKAPEGYIKDSWAASGYGICFDSDGNGTTEYVVENKPLPRFDLVKKQAGTDILIPNATFEHRRPDGTTEILSTDENGKLKFQGLEVGVHEVREIAVMEGYLINENVIRFSVDTDNKIVIISPIDDARGLVDLNITGQGKIDATVYDRPAPYGMVIHKQNEKGIPLEGAEFALYTDEACENELQAGITGADGLLKFAGLVAGDIYYLKETKAPAGYRIPVDESGNPLVTKIETSSIPAQDLFEFYVNGSKYDVSSEGAFSVTGTKAEREINIIVTNEIGKKLPSTGSSATLMLVLAGGMLFVLGISHINIKRKKEMKMKHNILKSLFTLSLVVIMAVASVTVNAATMPVEKGVVNFNRGEAQISIVGNGRQSLNGKKFHVYRLFDAENAVGLESINYTFNPDFKNALQTVVGEKLKKEASAVTEYEVIDYIQSLNHNEVEGAHAEQQEEGKYSDFRYFMESLRNEIVKEGVDGDVVTVTSTNAYNSFTISGLEYGYYVVDEITAVSDTYQAASLCIVNTANPTASVNIKSDYPSIVHKIREDDNRDLIGNGGWNDIGDYEIGQTVPYYYESGIPDMNGYSTYYYAWHDVMHEALTFHPESVSITISERDKSYELVSDEFAVTENPGNGDTFRIAIEDIKAIVDREFNHKNALNENTYGQKVVVKFNATLNDKAAKDMGRGGYENDVRLEFSNNPDSDGVGQNGFTLWDTVVCFSYQIDVLKTNNHNKELAGARFRLYSDKDCRKEVYVKKTEDGYNVINRDSVREFDVSLEAVEMVSDENGTIIINGIDAGTYYLKETEAPAGYRRLLDAIVLTVDATFTEERNLYEKGRTAEKVLKALDASAHVKKFLGGFYSEEDKELVTDADTGAVNITVINTVGSKLPVTGSAATIIMLAAGVGLILFFVCTKKKKESNEI